MLTPERQALASLRKRRGSWVPTTLVAEGTRRGLTYAETLLALKTLERQGVILRRLAWVAAILEDRAASKAKPKGRASHAGQPAYAPKPHRPNEWHLHLPRAVRATQPTRRDGCVPAA